MPNHSASPRAQPLRALLLALLVIDGSACGDGARSVTRGESRAREDDDRTPVTEEAARDEPSAHGDASSGEARDRPGSSDVAPDADQDAIDDAGAADLDAEAEDAHGAQPPAAGPPDGGAASAREDAGATRQITIRFKGEVAGQDFACGRSYDGQGSSAVAATPSDLRFFVHDLRLITEQGAEVAVQLATREPWQVPALALIDLEDAQGHCASGNPGTNAEITGSAPMASYSGLAFAVGVPPALNHEDPALAPAPLRNAPGMLWSWALGYKFVVAGLAQVVAEGQSGGQGSVHIGSAGCSGDVCMRPNRGAVRFARFDPDADVVVVDLGTIYARTDLATQAECHSFGPHCGAPFAALGVDYETGAPLAAHPAFHVRP